MITEDYVPYKIAKLLREKGFNELGYASIKVFANNSYEVNGEQVKPSKDTIIPTLQMAMKWLREVHKIHVAVYPYGEYSCDNYQFDVYKNNELIVSKDDGYITYEQACEAAIKYCLEKLF